MPKRIVYTAQIEYLQLLDEQGKLDEKLAPKGDPSRLTDEQVVFLYEKMIDYRTLDEVAFKLQRSGRMYTYPQNKGQEAVALGVGAAMKKGADYLVPCYRENAALFLHGLDPKYILLHWAGDERGNAIPQQSQHGEQGVNVSPIAIPIGTQMLHATGMAWAYKLRKEDRVVATFFGDGATSEGDFHEAMNFATVFNVPCIFICQNNHWAISVPRDQQMNSETVAQKAFAYGAHAIQVDGNDLFAVYKVAKEARERSAAGGGVTFIEAITYRLADHTTADDARRYRADAEVDSWKAKDPMIRLRKYLESQGLWDDAKQTAAMEKAEVWTKQIVDIVLNYPAPHRNEMFEHVYAELPEELKRQRDTWATHSLGQFPEQSGLNTSPQHA
jgi:pyruvate dehydrogenase E1 component alpha subunit